MHWTGNSWQQVSVDSVGTLSVNAITGNNAGEMWAVGENGLMVHHNGTSWQKLPTVVVDTLYGVTVSPLDSYPIAVGSKGTILRYGTPVGTTSTGGTTTGM